MCIRNRILFYTVEPSYTRNNIDLYDTSYIAQIQCSIARLKRDGIGAETRFRLSPKRTSPFKSAGASVQSTAGSRVVRINGSNAGYTTFRGSVKSIGYPLHSPVSPSLPLPCVTVCHHISNAPINSSHLNVTLFCSVRTTLVHNDTKYSVPFMTL